MNHLGFWRRCLLEAWNGSLGRANSLAALIGGAVLAFLAFVLHLDKTAPSSVEGSLAFQLVILVLSFVAAWLLVFVIQLFGAPARINRMTEKMLADSLDRRDQETLLGGRYSGDLFIYAGEITLCKQYDNASQLRALANGFDQIQVRAPRHSIAQIRLRFHHSREAHDFVFMIKDGNGEERPIEDVYTEQPVRLDENSQFGLKLLARNEFDWNRANLMVCVTGWIRDRRS